MATNMQDRRKRRNAVRIEDRASHRNHLSSSQSGTIRRRCISRRLCTALPENFECIFEALPSRFPGLEYDSSHMVRQFIAPIAPARQFKDRIYHVHAKDTEIIQPVLQRRGIHGDRWCRYRLPGFGEVKWNEMITVLLDFNYSGGIDIEHEDNLFGWGERAPDIIDAQKEGYRLALRYLGQFVPSRA